MICNPVRCEAFPTYPRTYDLVHAAGLLSLEAEQHRCSMLDIFTEIDRILRPEVPKPNGLHSIDIRLSSIFLTVLEIKK